MDVKPGYKQTEIGMIPKDWEVEKLGEHATFKTGPFGSALHKSDYVFGGVPVINPMQIENGQIIPTLSMAISEAAARNLSEFCVDTGEIVIGRRGEMGRCAVVLPEQRGWLCGTGSMVVRTKSSLDSRFAQRVLSSPPIIAEIENSSVGTTMINLNQGTLKNLLVPLPPTKAEQEAIAEALSDTDALIESLEQLITKKRQIKQCTMQELLTGKKRLPGFSGEWEEKTFGEVFDYHSTATNSRSDLTAGGDTYYIHYGDIHTRFHSHLNFEIDQPPRIERCKCRNATLLKNGDWVMVDASEDFNGVGKTIEILGLEEEIAAIAGLHTFLLREINPTFAPGFKGHLGNLKSLHDQFLRVATGMKVFGVSKTALKDLLLPVPSMREQAAIAAILSDMDAEIAALDEKLAKTKKIKQGMMQELLTGRIRLVSPAAKVISFPAKKKPATVTNTHNWEINEAVIIGVLAKNFGSEKYPLARKRCTKLTYLLHRHAEGKAEGYLKKAAGPYNPRTRYSGPEKIAQKNRYVRACHNGTYEGFVATDNVVKAEAYFQQWYGSDALAWLERFRYHKTDELELLATVDMAMEELKGHTRPTTLETVKRVILDHPEWNAKLDRETFSDDNIERAIQTCRELFI